MRPGDLGALDRSRADHVGHGAGALVQIERGVRVLAFVGIAAGLEQQVETRGGRAPPRPMVVAHARRERPARRGTRRCRRSRDAGPRGWTRASGRSGHVAATALLRHSRVRDVADEDVLEAEDTGLEPSARSSASTRRSRRIASPKKTGVGGGPSPSAVRASVEKKAACEGRTLEQSALTSGATRSRRAAMRPCSVGGTDRRDGRIGDPAPVALLDAPALHEHPKELLDVQRVALGARDDVASYLLRQVVDGQQRRNELARVSSELSGESVIAVAFAAALPTRAAPRGNQDARGKARERRTRPFSQILDEVEQPRLGPVDIFEHEDQRRRSRAALPRDIGAVRTRAPRAAGPGRTSGSASSARSIPGEDAHALRDRIRIFDIVTERFARSALDLLDRDVARIRDPDPRRRPGR